MSKAKIRVWAAVKDEDGRIVVDVRDVDTATIGPGTEDYRPWRYIVVGNGFETEDCNPEQPCGIGNPCTWCQKRAQKVWVTWEDHTAERFWRACREPEDFKGWNSLHWCTHKHRKKSASMRCAKKGGFHRIVQFNGHGERLESQPVGDSHGSV